jgi:anaerobic dimethyl sulfoxide reductase subunit C (anchor subunit)
MELRGWSLIIFTILEQMAVGAFLIFGILHYWASRRTTAENADRLSNYGLLALGPLLALALIASIFHLGNPLNAPRAVTNLGTSWLSREIFFSVLFVVVGGVFAVMQWREIASRAVRNTIAFIAALLGLALVYSMGRVYQLEAQPAWNSWVTSLSFFVTAFLLGMAAVGTAYVATYRIFRRQDPACEEAICALLHGALRWLALVAIILVGIELVVAPLYIGALAIGPEAARGSAELLVIDFGALFTIRLVLAFIGAGLLAVLIYQAASAPGQETRLAYLTYSAFALVLISEVVGRFLFYASHIRLGL